MKKIACNLLILLCTLSILCTSYISVAAEEYILSMPPLFSLEQVTSMLTPLASRLSQETGNNIKLLAAKNIDHYTAEVLHGNIVIGYENPSVYVNISNVHEALASAVTSQHDTLSKGIVITRPESGISTVEDLKGKKIMIVSRRSAGGFLSQKLTLQEKGIDIEQDCELTEAADQREENVIISVSIGDVDAGFINEYSLHKADKYIAPGSVISVAKTAPLPNWVISVSRNMPEIQKDELQQALLGLSPEDPALKALGIAAFERAVDTDYDIIRNILE
ncbi:MAG: phosphate/phosphite/phosphonate ABC transporter substrate-binding protein [Candidatus Electrothrix sp. AW5]|nr:phosphate/phosphite/phosphonate ABC transporter substrate-binding protein [Candidatus Electrothrix sp. AX1]MCI5179302.1 phosphate/phosphite/phosphonate ABC transporter substrate-binding protein [Candidatus Electrothrix gigas]MCI5182057.1 phosphate/phosphite/phosphonate ABC transporter substrate-binding protein [Candidatus Electrothrix gigas]MCI5193241.1 phosphate/phosphite/phosphonate ABC transporter substrate-binding protein [Candidatus Electrothrix gigas]MCI5196548.1 phosphate/phosphite/ph